MTGLGRASRAAVLIGLVTALVAACAPPPSTPAPSRDIALGYGAPAPSPVAYSVADTATFSVHSGAMGAMTATSAHTAIAEMRMSPGTDTVEARVRFLQFRGSLRAEPHGAQHVDERAMAGEFLVRLDRRGRIEIVETPVLSPELLELTSAEALVRPLFVHLPARAVQPGDQWVDTLSSAEESPETRTTARTVLTSTLVGDTLVDGRAMLLLRTHAENRIEMTGRAGGVAIRQILVGNTAGSVVWDPSLHLLVERREEGHLSGTLAMPDAGVSAIPMTASVRRIVSLER